MTIPGLSQWDDLFIAGMVWLIDRPKWLILGGVANLLACGGLYSLIEGAGPIEGGYWGVVTASSTGYGDFSPSHTLGRLVAVYLIISMIFVWVPAFAAMLIGRVSEHTGDAWSHEEQQQLLDDVGEILVYLRPQTPHEKGGKSPYEAGVLHIPHTLKFDPDTEKKE